MRDTHTETPLQVTKLVGKHTCTSEQLLSRAIACEEWTDVAVVYLCSVML